MITFGCFSKKRTSKYRAFIESRIKADAIQSEMSADTNIIAHLSTLNEMRARDSISRAAHPKLTKGNFEHLPHKMMGADLFHCVLCSSDFASNRPADDICIFEPIRARYCDWAK